ncbi:MAG: addiction module antidote protein, HigA family [Gammaproteobacteria bacterium]|nr:MAG: addiction module antidote protein, HigA family [Gammaproteobacteria bacterium]
MAMRKPPHPGRQIKSALDACELNITEGAEHLGVTRNTLSHVINGLAGISPDMALRLNKAFGGGAEIWVRMQASYDLAQAREHEDEIDVRRLKFA